jgi:uncharacterized membrane-anchored protein
MKQLPRDHTDQQMTYQLPSMLKNLVIPISESSDGEIGGYFLCRLNTNPASVAVNDSLRGRTRLGSTTLGETAGDTVTMTLSWGYLAGTALFFAALVVLVGLQIMAKRFHPFLYWATIIASTTFGTTMADFADRSLGIGYTGGSSLLLLCLLVTLGLWYRSLGTISVDTVNTPKAEIFYWAAITFSQTLGTALGDWMADSTGLGYEGGALVFGAALAIVAAAYYWTKVSRVTLFWTAFILTRPLGATVGDFLDKPVKDGGLALSRPLASAAIAAFILVCLVILPQRAGSHPGQAGMAGD